MSSPPPSPPFLHPTQYFTSCLNLSLRPLTESPDSSGRGGVCLLTEAAVSSSHSLSLRLCAPSPSAALHSLVFRFGVKTCEICVSVNVCLTVLSTRLMERLLLWTAGVGCVQNYIKGIKTLIKWDHYKHTCCSFVVASLDFYLLSTNTYISQQ